jgi:2-polyprenyl-6-methoxyphenol hydroxylase-like FAD-dependent oxidoreductase
MKPDYDAIIVGGGPAGATAAALLAQAGWRIALVEKTPFPRRKVCGEFISGTTWPLLRQLGIAGSLLEIAGPVVRRVGVYAGDAMVSAELAAPTERTDEGGRALGREYLDTLLLERATELGADIWQPWTLSGIAAKGDGYDCTIAEKGRGQTRELRSRLIIAAHGSWESGAMPTQALRCPPRAGDLFGFKAHFTNSALPIDLMPLIAFPGGYGGMVHTDGCRVSLSCCIRREQLARCRQILPHANAGPAVLAHIEASCKGVALALSSATLDGVWLSAGPLRTGVRTFGKDGIFAVGNAAAEAHPIVAEGISMAIQSACLLCEQLIARQRRYSAFSSDELESIRYEYAANWRRNFSRRLQLAALFAHLFMRPICTRIAAGVLERVPQLLTQGARWSGKADRLRGARQFDVAQP